MQHNEVCYSKSTKETVQPPLLAYTSSVSSVSFVRVVLDQSFSLQVEITSYLTSVHDLCIVLLLSSPLFYSDTECQREADKGTT